MNDYDIYNIFHTFMNRYDLYPHQIPQYPNYYVNRMGQVFDSNMNQIKPYHYNDNYHYDSFQVYDDQNVSHILGVHQAVAMTFNPDWYHGCVVHHIDENKYNNWDTNLAITNRSSHASNHNPQRYFDTIATCQVCGKQFKWPAIRQQHYVSDIKRNKNRFITCSRHCSSYIGRMTQLNRDPDLVE